MKRKRGVRIVAIVIAVLLALSLLIMPFASMAHAAEKEDGITILFTHDLHDHMLPINVTDASGNTTSSGGYARLKTVLDTLRAKHQTTITVDAGDFSMGSLFQTIYATDAPELRMLGALGYDAVTLGNHEFDYSPNQLAAMLMAAKESGDVLPPIVQSNYTTLAETAPEPSAGGTSLPEALDACGVQPYTILERNGIKIAVFGIMGYDADVCAPNSNITLQDPIKTAAAIVDEIEEKEAPDLIVCLSHGGTNEIEKKSEDQNLAKAVPAIDLIISGHTHTTLEAPIQVGTTYIVSSGSYCRNLGEITLIPDGDHWTLKQYTLHPIDDSLAEDAAIAEKIEGFKKIVETAYLSAYDMTFDQVLAKNDVVFTPAEDIDFAEPEIGLGNLLADSYIHTISQIEGADYEPITMAVVPSGVIRASLPRGVLTTADVFDTLSLGIGADGTVGYPLVSAYLTGKELSAVAEIDASISALFSPARLYFSGIKYTSNPSRIPMDFVSDVKLVQEDGSTTAPNPDRLYRIVTDLYSAQMLASVQDMAFGMIKLTPKDQDGNKITDLTTHILHDQNGNEIKAWQCAAAYLSSFAPDEDGISTVPARYGAAEGRKIVHNDASLGAVVSNPGTSTLLVIGALFVFTLLVIWIARYFLRRWAKRVDYHEDRL